MPQRGTFGMLRTLFWGEKGCYAPTKIEKKRLCSTRYKSVLYWIHKGGPGDVTLRSHHAGGYTRGTALRRTRTTHQWLTAGSGPTLAEQN